MRALLMVFMCSVTLVAQQPAPATVTNQDLLAGLPSDGSKWLMYHGNYFGHRLSPLTQITPQNVNQLKAQWTFQTGLTPNFQTTPLLVDNVLYVTASTETPGPSMRDRAGRSGGIAATCPTIFAGAAVRTTAGMAVHGDRLFLGTGDAHLVALDMKTGDVLWESEARRLHEGLLGYGGADRRERQSHYRHGRRRVRHSWVHRRVGCEYGQERRGNSIRWPGRVSRAVKHGRRGVGRVPPRRRVDLGDGHLRSGTEPGVLRNRESGAGLLQSRRAKATTSTRARPSRWTPTRAR